jgi:hypothetical protein
MLERSMAENLISRARDHVLRGHEIVARQRTLIQTIRAQGRDAADAEELLMQFEASLRIFEEDLVLLEQTGANGRGIGSPNS